MNLICGRCGCELPHPHEMGMTTAEYEDRVKKQGGKWCAVCIDDMTPPSDEDISEANLAMIPESHRDEWREIFFDEAREQAQREAEAQAEDGPQPPDEISSSHTCTKCGKLDRVEMEEYEAQTDYRKSPFLCWKCYSAR